MFSICNQNWFSNRRITHFLIATVVFYICLISFNKYFRKLHTKQLHTYNYKYRNNRHLYDFYRIFQQQPKPIDFSTASSEQVLLNSDHFTVKIFNLTLLTINNSNKLYIKEYKKNKNCTFNVINLGDKIQERAI